MDAKNLLGWQKRIFFAPDTRLIAPKNGDKSFLPSPRPFLLEPRPPVIHYYLDLPDNLRAVLLACSAVNMDRYPPIASVTNNIVNSS